MGMQSIGVSTDEGSTTTSEPAFSECGCDVAGCRLIDTCYHDRLAIAIQMTSKIVGLLQLEIADES